MLLTPYWLMKSRIKYNLHLENEVQIFPQCRKCKFLHQPLLKGNHFTWKIQTYITRRSILKMSRNVKMSIGRLIRANRIKGIRLLLPVYVSKGRRGFILMFSDACTTRKWCLVLLVCSKNVWWRYKTVYVGVYSFTFSFTFVNDNRTLR